MDDPRSHNTIQCYNEQNSTRKRLAQLAEGYREFHEQVAMRFSMEPSADIAVEHATLTESIGQRNAVLSPILKKFFDSRPDPFPTECDVAAEVEDHGTTSGSAGWRIRVDIDELSSDLLVRLEVSMMGEELKDIAWHLFRESPLSFFA
ncbi:hypothetical protein N7519_010651 [Penicillium mononematosum]|uniref:uncharacterized protein n=1 Tax=Penicillium mononematosum TaxID=268346 RepID=UPI002547B522|nr:uncharacterized protein N7519_010651 [Penicillium mononematosum]KAJ6180190.1 hypothetical protein N7519_010651 [Penicillium mononematosum]